jgi:ferredoxin-NADP reductase
VETLSPAAGRGGPERLYSGPLRRRRALSASVFEIGWERPAGFSFVPGQRVRLALGAAERDYTLVSAPPDPELRVCFRRVEAGALSPQLASAPIGSRLLFSGPHGYFVYRPSARPAVFVATGVGIAPFCAMAAAGITGFTLLHGARRAEELYYREVVAPAAARYRPCLSGGGAGFAGRVTAYLEERLAAGQHDFYLCGRREMVRDATLLIDRRFPGSRVYSEVFF